MFNKRIAILLSTLLVLTSCGQTSEEIRDEFLATDSFDQMQASAQEIRTLGSQGVPIFLEAISNEIETQYSLKSYGRINVSLKNLHALAKEGVCDKTAAPVLFKLLEKQLDMSASLITAETLEIITGVNVGYNEEYIRSYTSEDEPKRKEMIARWRLLAGAN